MNRIEKAVGAVSELKGIKRVLYLVMCAFVSALPFMAEKLWIFGWFGLSLLFVAIFDFKKPLKRVFGSLFCFFFFFYVFAYSWFVSLYPLDFAGLGNFSSAAVIVIAETLIPLIHTSLMTPLVFLGVVAAGKTDNGFLKAALVGFGYVIGEFMQSLGPLAFPWAMLFVGQADRLEILQSASLFGARFLTFLIVFVNMLFTLCLQNAKNIKKARIYAFAAVLLFVSNFAYGTVRLATSDNENAPQISAAVLQGNIPSSEKWDPDTKPATEKYLELARELKDYCTQNAENVDVAVLPETAFASSIYEGSRAYLTSAEIAEMLSCNLFVGAFDSRTDNSYNSIFLFDDNGKMSKETYNKVNLVPFGEFLPYRKMISTFLPTLAEINMLSSDLTAGMPDKPIKSEYGNAACLVCFDSIFPENTRIQAKNGADFIVVSTNDSWYKESKALYQHAAHSVMRAVENNLPVIRSANTGISLICDSYGRILAESCVGEYTFITAGVPLADKRSLYTLTGDLILPLSFVFVFGTLICSFVKNKILPKKRED